MLKKIFSFLFSLSFLICFCCPVSSASIASPVGVTLDGQGIVAIADWIADNVIVKGSTQISNWIEHLYDEDTCPQSVEANGRHKFVKMNTSVDGRQGIYYICEACGQSAGEVLDKVESEYVGTLPATEITSDGGYLWYPTKNNFNTFELYFLGQHQTVPHNDSEISLSFYDNRTIRCVYKFSQTRTGALSYCTSHSYNNLSQEE